MNIKVNTRMFHTGQKAEFDFINLRNPWVAKIFGSQLFKKTNDFDVKVVNYVLMNSHYHLQVLVGSERAYSEFMKFFVRDFTREVRTYIRNHESEKRYESFLNRRIFEKRPFFRPVYSVKDIWVVFRYIVQNPVLAYEEVLFSKDYYFSGANDIYKGFSYFIDFNLLSHLLGESDLKKCVEIAEQSDEAFDAFLDKRFQNWTAKDDELLLRFTQDFEWKPQKLIPMYDESTVDFDSMVIPVSPLTKR